MNREHVIHFVYLQIYQHIYLLYTTVRTFFEFIAIFHKNTLLTGLSGKEGTYQSSAGFLLHKLTNSAAEFHCIFNRQSFNQ